MSSLLSIQSLLLLGRELFIENNCSPLLSLETPPHQKPPNPDDEGCKLLDSFAIIVQIALASSALVTLFYKRSREKPQRPVSVW